MVKTVYLHCMMCGHDYSEEVEEGVDEERSCPDCRSNSIRVMKEPLARDQKK